LISRWKEENIHLVNSGRWESSMKWYYRLIISIVLFSLAITLVELTVSNDDYALYGAIIGGLIALAGFVVLLYLSPKDIEERARRRNEGGSSDSYDSQSRSVELKESMNSAYMHEHNIRGASYGPPERNFNEGKDKDF
jgi:hypothetical protein